MGWYHVHHYIELLYEQNTQLNQPQTLPILDKGGPYGSHMNIIKVQSSVYTLSRRLKTHAYQKTRLLGYRDELILFQLEETQRSFDLHFFTTHAMFTYPLRRRESPSLMTHCFAHMSGDELGVVSSSTRLLDLLLGCRGAIRISSTDDSCYSQLEMMKSSGKLGHCK